MKINELVLRNRFVVEAGPVPPAAPAAKGPGLWDQIKQGANKLQAGIAGAKAGYTGSQAQQAGQAEAEEIGSMYFKKWNSAIGQNPALNTAANLQAFMQNSTKKSGIKVPPPPAGELNPAVTSKYIIDVIGKSFAASDLGLPSERQDDTVPQQPQGPQQAAQPAATDQAQAQPTASTTTPTSTDQAATQSKTTYGSGTSVTPTNVTQQTSTVATTQKADELIANANPEDLEAMLAALEGPQA